MPTGLLFSSPSCCMAVVAHDGRVLVKPTEPSPDACCGQGCGRACVFEVYDRKMEKYNEAAAQQYVWERVVV